MFQGTFGITSEASAAGSITIDPTSGDTIKLNYDASHPRAELVIDGVTQSGKAELREIILPNGDNPSPLTSNAVELTLADGAQLAQPTNPILSQVCGNVVFGSGDGGGGSDGGGPGPGGDPGSGNGGTAGGGSESDSGGGAGPGGDPGTGNGGAGNGGAGNGGAGNGGTGGAGGGGPEPVQTCGGNITISMSYANVPLTFEQTPVTDNGGCGEGGCGAAPVRGGGEAGNGNAPTAFTLPIPSNTQQSITASKLTLWEKVGDSWIDLSQFGPVTVDENTKTVTAISPFGPGIFVIGVEGLNSLPPCPGCGGGGGGGGIPLPGSGVVLDFIAGVIVPPPAPPPVTPPTNTLPSIPSALNSAPVRNLTAPSASVISTSSDNTVSLSGVSPLTTRVVEQAAHKVTSLEKHSGNKIFSIPGEGNVTLSFASLVSGDNLWVSVIKTPSELVALNITNGTSHKGEILTTLNKTSYSVVGTVFNIGPTDIRLNGTLTVSIPYHASLVTGAGSQVRMLHFTGTAWEDVTTLPPANGHSVTGTITSPGSVVAAVKSM
jgi:hypothetical protein